MPFSTVLAKHSNKTVRLDTYQKLLLTQIDCYGQGSWKNGVSLHHLYDQRGAFANILIHGTVVGKVGIVLSLSVGLHILHRYQNAPSRLSSDSN